MFSFLQNEEETKANESKGRSFRVSPLGERGSPGRSYNPEGEAHDNKGSQVHEDRF